MREKACRFCLKAIKIESPQFIETITSVKIGDAITRWKRLCDQGGETVSGFDHCIAKHEFKRNRNLYYQPQS